MQWIALVALGRLAIWTLQVNGLTEPIFSAHPKLKELRDCDFCLGFWVFSILAWLFGANLLYPLSIPVVSEASTGLLLSFGVHLARLGWESKFGIVYLGEHED